MSNLLLIWGAGGHGKVVLDVARSTGHFEAIVFLDDDLTRSGGDFCGCRVIGGSGELDRYSGSAFIITIGDNQRRASCFRRAIENELMPATLVHANAVVSPSARVGRGSVVMPGAIINSGASIGDNCIVNTGAIVEHDCEIADHVHISPRVALGGGVTVGAYAHVGISATVLPGAFVGEESIVGAGSVVLKTVPAHRTVVGIPSRILPYSTAT